MSITTSCRDCRYCLFVGVASNPGDLWCEHPHLLELLDSKQHPVHHMIHADAARDFKFACGHEAKWFEPKKGP